MQHETDVSNLADLPLPEDSVGLLEGLCTTRAIRRYTDERVPASALRAMLFAATRGPSGSNRQPFRFVVLDDPDRDQEARQLIGRGAHQIWGAKVSHDGYDKASAIDTSSAKARMARAMDHYVANIHRAPVIVLPCLSRYRAPTPIEGASVYPACQNLLLAARALGYGGALTGFHLPVEDELRAQLGVPDGVLMAATITIGRPAGRQGPVRRRPMADLVYAGGWDSPAPWAVDPPGTAFAGGGPPPPLKWA